jgi:DNA-binding SARP family transcriptional activator/tetratricopeptide (TPR) repeat protein
MTAAMGWQLHATPTPRLVAQHAGGGVIVPARRDAAWLAYVALNPGAASLQVAVLLWPGVSERGALNNLRQRLHRLRKATGARLVEMAETITLAADLAPPWPADRGALESDPAAWDGELLGDFEYDEAPEFSAWLAAERRQRRDARREALADIASVAEREGQLARALLYAQRLLADDPLSEHAQRRLMRLHYLRGDTAAAVAAFERGERVLKDELGLRPSAETIELLHTVERSRPVAARLPAALPASLSRPPRLIGRDTEMAALAQAERDAQVALLVGEAGFGKTRLLQERLAGRTDAVHVQARPGDAAGPYATLARLLRALGPWSAAVVAGALALVGAGPGAAPAAASPARLQAAIESLLSEAAAAGLRLIAVDDLHFADRASTEMLIALTGAERLDALHWVFAHRPASAADDDAQVQVLAPLAESTQARSIALGPLDEAALGELLASLALDKLNAGELTAVLWRHTGGSPLFVIETLRTAWAEGRLNGPLPKPRGLTPLIDQRLRRLSPAAIALARVAALAMPDFSLALAEEVLAAPAIVLASAWHELEAAQVLRGEAFAHDLVHDAMLRATPKVIAVHAHRQIARFLAGRDVAPARLAWHWQAAEEPRAAAAAWAEAAARAVATGRLQEQADLLERCATAWDNAGEGHAALRARIDRVGALMQCNGFEPALALADGLVESSRGTPLAAHALTARSLALWWGGQAASAEACARQALGAASPDDLAVVVAASAVLGSSHALRGEHDAALALMQPLRDRVEGHADVVVQRDYFGNLTALLLATDRSAEARDCAERHLALARISGHGGEQLTALMNLSNLHGRRGDAQRAIEHAREADRLAPDSAQTRSLGPWNRASLGFWLAGVGGFAEAIGLLEAAIDALASDDGNPLQLQLAQGLLARVWLTLGQPARAVALVHGMTDAPPGRLRAGQLSVRARVAMATGGGAVDLWRGVMRESGPTDVAHIGAAIELAATDADASALLDLQRRAERLEYFPLAAEAATLRLACLTHEPAALEAAVQAAERLAAAVRSPMYYLPTQLGRCAAAWRLLGRLADERRCIEGALHWVHRDALPQVPPAFTESFLHRNEVNAALRAAAARFADPAGPGANPPQRRTPTSS